jgi:hypothetical protein
MCKIIKHCELSAIGERVLCAFLTKKEKHKHTYYGGAIINPDGTTITS